MTSQPNHPESIHDVALAAFHQRQASAGVLVVRKLVSASAEDRELACKETVEYLSACTNEQLDYYAQKLEYLYAATGTVGQDFGLRDVDVFARAFFSTLEMDSRTIDRKTVETLGHTVLRGRYMSQSPKARPSYGQNLRLISAAT